MHDEFYSLTESTESSSESTNNKFHEIYELVAEEEMYCNFANEHFYE